MSDKSHKTLKGEMVDLQSLAADERKTLQKLVALYQKKPDWGEFENFWPGRLVELYQGRGLSRKQMIRTPVYQVAQDLASRLAVAQGHARLPDYRGLLGALIREKFNTRRDFCKATGLAEDLLSHVLSGRKHLAMDTLTKALERIGFRLAFVPVEVQDTKKVKSAG
jgi:hypothetical protein